MKKSVISAVLAIAAASSANAHANLVEREAQAGSTYVAEMRIAHGCEGEATHTVRIDLPEGFVLAKPRPKAGWDLSVEFGTYAQTYDYHGPRTEGVTSITWSNGNLEDWQFDTFDFRAYLSPKVFHTGDTVYIPVHQYCANGEHLWTEIPVEGQDRPAHPAPALKITGGATHKH